MKNFSHVEELHSSLDKSELSLCLKDKEINASIFDYDSAEESAFHVSWLE